MAYRKIFMSVDANSVGIEERLTELVLLFLSPLPWNPNRPLPSKKRNYMPYAQVIYFATLMFTFCRSRIKNWVRFLLYVQWCSLFVILLQKIDVEYASSDIGVALENTLLWVSAPLPSLKRIFGKYTCDFGPANSQMIQGLLALGMAMMSSVRTSSNKMGSSGITMYLGLDWIWV